MIAGAKYRGEFEERLKRIVEEAQNDSAVIIVIDEIHTLVGAGAAEGAVDAANILKPALARGKFRCIGATTNDEYRKYIERDPALERRFQPVHVEEPSVGTTIEILRGLRSKFEQHHTLSYHDKALEQAAILSDKYVADRYLPDKAIDVLDEAGARVRLENRRLPLGLRSLMHELQETIKDKEDCIKEHDFEAAKQLLDHEMEVRTHIRIMKQSALTSEARGFSRRDVDMVTEEDVSAVVSNWTGIPVTKITGSESARLLKMEDTIHERIIGQKHAVIAVSKAIRRARVGNRRRRGCGRLRQGAVRRGQGQATAGRRDQEEAQPVRVPPVGAGEQRGRVDPPARRRPDLLPGAALDVERVCTVRVRGCPLRRSQSGPA